MCKDWAGDLNSENLRAWQEPSCEPQTKSSTGLIEKLEDDGTGCTYNARITGAKAGFGAECAS